MPLFQYRALDPTGKTINGSLDAPDRRALVKRLRAQQMQPVQVSAAGGAASAGPEESSPPQRRHNPVQDESAEDTQAPSAFTRFRLSAAETKGRALALPFLEKLLQLHGSGMPLGDSVSLMSQRVQSPGLKALAHDIWRDLSEGHTLASCIRKRPETFEPSISYLIEAGEATGNLAPILDNVTQNLERQRELKKTIYGSLAYPIFIVMLAFGVGLLAVYYLMPQIQGMIASLGGEMSFSARLMMGFSHFSVSYLPFIAVGLVIAGLAFFQWRRTARGRQLSDQWLLRAPLLGPIVQSSDVCRASNVLATLLENGVNTTESLRLSENTLNNTRLRARFARARQLINDGAPFSTAFSRHRVLTQTDLDILAVGENTGSVVSSLREVFKLHTGQLRRQFKLLTTSIAGAALGLAFTLVAILIFGVVTSILQLTSSLSAQ